MKIKKLVCAAWLAGLTALGTAPTQAQATDPFIGQLMLFGGNFCPRGFEKAEGQLLSIASNSALFSIFGTMYGGDGRFTFGLPDLRGRSAIGPGQGPGLTNFQHGAKVGNEQEQILVQNMPAHRHKMNVTNSIADKGGPGGKYLAAMGNAGTAGPFVYSQADTNKTLADDAISFEGAGVPLNNRAPSLAIQWCVATEGIFPSRS